MSVANPNHGLDFSPFTPAYTARQARVDARRDAHIRALVLDAQARGVVALECERCGARHGLGMIGEACNAADSERDGEACGGFDLAEVRNPGDEVTVWRAKAGLL